MWHFPGTRETKTGISWGALASQTSLPREFQTSVKKTRQDWGDGSEGDAQRVTCRMCKYDERSSDPQVEPSPTMHICNPRVPTVRREGGEQQES